MRNSGLIANDSAGFEGCVELTGPVVHHFTRFWQSFWVTPDDLQSLANAQTSTNITRRLDAETSGTSQAVFLPSPHHALSLFDGTTPVAPPTPLNLFILAVLSHATRSIYIQTPNLTSTAVLNGILATLTRGVDVRIVTSERLMIMEQLVTARTTTARCVRWLAKKHEKLLVERARRNSTDVEALLQPTGRLEVLYYQPRPQTSDPVQSHIKLTIADDEVIVLGSGNLDRASWVTSQELGVALVDAAFVRDFREQLKEALYGRLRFVYPLRLE